MITRTEDGKLHPLFLSLFISCTVVLYMYRVPLAAWAEHNALEVLTEHLSLDALMTRVADENGLWRLLLLGLGSIILGILALIVGLVLWLLIALFKFYVLQIPVGWGLAFVLTFVLRKTVWPIALDTYLGITPNPARLVTVHAVPIRGGAMHTPPSAQRGVSQPTLLMPSSQEIERAAENPLAAYFLRKALERQRGILTAGVAVVRLVREGREELVQVERAQHELDNLQETLALETKRLQVESADLDRRLAAAARAEEREKIEHAVTMKHLQRRLAGEGAKTEDAGKRAVEYRLREMIAERLELAEAEAKVRAEILENPDESVRKQGLEALRDVVYQLQTENLDK